MELEVEIIMSIIPILKNLVFGAEEESLEAGFAYLALEWIV